MGLVWMALVPVTLEIESAEAAPRSYVLAEVMKVARATETHVSRIACVGFFEGTRTIGDSNSYAREIRLGDRRVCQPIVKYKRTGTLTNWTVDARRRSGTRQRTSARCTTSARPNAWAFASPGPG
jgi:hypothetical protein